MVPDPSSSITQGGTIRWMSPELIRPENFGFESSRPTKESDSYALGMVILEVLSDQVPFAGDTFYAVIMKVTEGERPKRPHGAWFTDDLWETLGWCWSPKPEARPAIEAVLKCLEWQSLRPNADSDRGTYGTGLTSTSSFYCA